MKKTCLAIPSSLTEVGILREDLSDLLSWGKENNFGAQMKILERPDCETNTDYRQIIPYAYVCLDDNILAYRRSNSHTESRLADKWSIGFGGHMEPHLDQDLTDAFTPYKWYGEVLGCLHREITEEVGLASHEVEPVYKGRIVLADTAVDSVHFGLVFEVHPHGLSESEIEDRIVSEEVAETEWLDRYALKNLAHDQFDWESWSKHVITEIL